TAETVDRDDHRDDEQQDRALAAIAAVVRGPIFALCRLAAIEPDAGAEDHHRGNDFDQADRIPAQSHHTRSPSRSPCSQIAPRKNSIAVADIIISRPKRFACSGVISPLGSVMRKKRKPTRNAPTQTATHKPRNMSGLTDKRGTRHSRCSM